MVKVLQIVGYKNSGKTTVMCNLIACISKRGYAVGSIKHEGGRHGFESDVTGTDSWRHRQAGSLRSAVVSNERTAIIEEKTTPLPVLIERMNDVDLILIEGFKDAPYPKLALISRSTERHDDPAKLLELPSVIAAVVWPGSEHVVSSGWIRFSIDDVERIADYVLRVLNENEHPAK